MKDSRVFNFYDVVDLLIFYIRILTRVSPQRKEEMLCNPCLLGNIRTAAKSFCKTCEDPEPLCEVCGNLHKRQKATKHHDLSIELAQFPRLIPENM